MLEWLQKCNIAFDFYHFATNDDRKSALKVIMNCPAGPYPLKQEEKDIISAEYVKFIVNAEEVKRNSTEKLTQTQLRYTFLAEEKFYSKFKRFNEFALMVIKEKKIKNKGK